MGYRRAQEGASDEARGWLDRAAQQYQEAVRLDPWRALPRARLAWLHGVMNATLPGGEAGFSETLALFLSAMALEPRNPYPFRLMAVWAFRRAANFGDDSASEREVLLELGYSATRRALDIQSSLLPELAGMALEFSKDYRQLARLLPEGPPSRIALARFLNQRSLRLEGTDPERSRELWLGATAAFEDGMAGAARAGRADALIQAQGSYAGALLQHHLAESALALVRKGKATSEGAPELAFVEAEALVALGRLDEAEPAYRHAIGLAGRFGETGRRLHLLEALARLYERMRVPERALSTWREVLSLNPQEGEARVGMGRAWDALGQPEHALGEYRTAVAVSPHDAGVRSRVADALFRRRLYSEAMGHWEVLVRDHPDDSEAHVRLAESHESLGDSASARRHYLEAFRLAPGNTRVQSALARLGGSPSSP
jgi:tetratricopeptide (TPR) repeat protein